MPKPNTTETEDIRITDLQEALAASRHRADTAEAALKDLQDEVAEDKLARAASDPSAEHVTMRKGGEEISVHPSTLAAHKTAGWTRA